MQISESLWTELGWVPPSDGSGPKFFDPGRGFGQFFVARVESGQLSLVWARLASYLLRVKSMPRLGQVRSGPIFTPALANWPKSPNWEFKSKVVCSIPSHASNFSTQDCKKINKVPPVRVKVIFFDHRFLWRDLHKGVDEALILG